MPLIDLKFPVLGPSLASDHGYDLYAALSRQLPVLHDGLPCHVGPIAGTYAGGGRMHLDPRRSHLRLRLPPEGIPQVLSLSGKALDVGSHQIRLGVPQVAGLVPAEALYARLVTIKGFTEPAEFLAAARRQLDTLQVAGEIGIPLCETGPHAGKPRRRVLRVKGKKVVGFPLLLTGMSAEESLMVQERGIGGRSKMGCGFFVPWKEG